MHDLVVDAGADDAGERRVAPVALERADGTRIADHPRGDLVELAGGDARDDVRGNHVQHLGGEAAGDAHFFDFFRGFN